MQSDPGVSAPERPPPLWTALALILSGVVVIIIETFSLLVVLGGVFLAIGLYLLVARRGRTPQ